ncbi:MAG: hypothetical protein ACLQJR_26600 [Stellaceae bacterium]
MLIYHGDALGIDGLREILGTMAQHFDRRMLLARWDDGESMSYMITIDDAVVAGNPACEPLILAWPNGAWVPVPEGEHGRQVQHGRPR